MNTQEQKEKFHYFMKMNDSYFKHDFSLFIDKNFNLNEAINEKQEYPLTVCIKEGHDNFTEICIEKGSDVNFTNQENEYPIFTLCREDVISYPLLSFLLSHEANPNIVNKNDNNYTPLHYVAKKTRVDLFDLLLRYDADISLLDSENNNALMLLLTSVHDYKNHELAIINTCLKSDFNIHQININNDNLLTLFLNKLSWEDIDLGLTLTKAIIEKGINLTQQNNSGKTAFHLAIEMESTELMLLTYHDKIDLTTINSQSIEDENVHECFESLTLKQKLDNELIDKPSRKIKL